MNVSLPRAHPTPMTRPAKDSWQLKSDSDGTSTGFDSTSDMLASGIPLHGREAAYRFTAKPAEDWTRKDQANHALSVAALGGGLGLTVGFASSMLADLGNGIFPGGFIRPALSTTLAMGIGLAAVAGIAAYAAGPEPQEALIAGVLQEDSQSQQVHFHPGGLLDGSVNLSEFQKADVPKLGPDGRDYGEQWWNRSE